MFFELLAIIGAFTSNSNADTTSAYFMDAAYVKSYDSVISNSDDDEEDEQEITVMVNKKNSTQDKKKNNKSGKFLNIAVNEGTDSKVDETITTTTAEKNDSEKKQEDTAIAKEFANQRMQHLMVSIAQDLGYSITITQ